MLTQHVWPCCTSYIVPVVRRTSYIVPAVRRTLYPSYAIHCTCRTSYIIPLYGRTIVRWPWHYFSSYLLCCCCHVSYSAIKDLWLRVFHMYQTWAWTFSPWCSKRCLGKDSSCCPYVLKELGPCSITLVILLVYHYCYKPCHCALSLLLGYFIHWFGIDVYEKRVCKRSAIRYCSEESYKFIHLVLPLSVHPLLCCSYACLPVWLLLVVMAQQFLQ